MNFLYVASESFNSRAKVLHDSLVKHHPYSEIVRITPPNTGVIGQYLPNMARDRLIETKIMLDDTNEDVCVIGADCELFKSISLPMSYDLTIVPHVKKPLKDRNYMRQLYMTGHANADLMIFKNSDQSREILDWLIDVTEDGMKDGAFYEQTWLSATPFIFDNVGVIRHPGYNVGYWEANHVKWEYKDGRYLVNNFPVVMMQYSGYLKGEPERMSRHSTETCKDPIALQLYKDYDRRITS